MLDRLAEEMAGIDVGALFSPCRRWRYLLWRRWDAEGEPCMFIGLNPSTADETINDPTVNRCINFAKAWGYGSLWMLNLFAFRATQPSVMKAQGGAAVGPVNDEYLLMAARAAGIVVAAWGTDGEFRARGSHVRKTLRDEGMVLHYLRLTRDGHPSHPLYLPGTLVPQEWRRLSAD